ncbi:hypothetical protein NECAME_10892 [Necator americanus]|uniref:DUF4440 domain-containing protein n=1 Tax=Necator americanus TaxID=51031 RepID=W2T7P1_NECAM|nr:hypothetical protein NECAME_10892 [Necator americanus]ETN77644.1 hypothetical protein NECAME_10892 [Necator americanus]
MCSNQEATSILKPHFDDYVKKLEEHHVEEATEYYDPDATLVHVGNKGIYGREAIKKELLEFDQRMGEVTNKFTGVQYQKTGDFLIISANYETNTEKMGMVKGKFTQIWRKSNNKYLILHDEFSIE